MKTYQGHCHCGSVQFTFQSPEVDRAIRCNCSMCARKGAAMLSHTLAPDALQINDNDGTLSEYQFGSFEAKHFFCSRCGIYTFHQTKRALGQYRVNLACIDEIDALALPVEVFDGKHLL